MDSGRRTSSTGLESGDTGACKQSKAKMYMYMYMYIYGKLEIACLNPVQGSI